MHRDARECRHDLDQTRHHAGRKPRRHRAHPPVGFVVDRRAELDENGAVAQWPNAQNWVTRSGDHECS
jgi:hypothetical protein